MLIFFFGNVGSDHLLDLDDLTQLYWEKFRGHDGLVCFSELLTGEGERELQASDTDCDYQHTSHQGIDRNFQSP